jgi:hypothetical protein
MANEQVKDEVAAPGSQTLTDPLFVGGWSLIVYRPDQESFLIRAFLRGQGGDHA